MKNWHQFSHHACEHYISEYFIGFRIVKPTRGDVYEGRKFRFHSLVFVLEGEVEFSYNEFIGHRFKQGDMFFVPQAAFMYGMAITDARVLVLTFSNSVNTLCKNSSLPNHTAQIDSASYQFAPLTIKPLLQSFIELTVEYLQNELRCGYLHQLKQRELFIVLQYCYTPAEVIKLFYPALGKPSFYTWVLENYKPDMSMTQLAGMCNMTPKSFSRKFYDVFGLNFRGWMLEQRVKHIKLRLSMRDATFKEIMRDFNFSNSSHFARFCKVNYGMTPTEMIAQVRSKDPHA